MFKHFTLCCLLLFLLLLSAVICCMWLIKFKPESVLAEKLHNQIIRNSELRNILRLKQVGDARFEYLRPEHSTIFVRIFYPSNKRLQAELPSWIKNMIKVTTGKSTQLSLHPSSRLRGLQPLSLEQLRLEAALLPTPTYQPVLNIVYVSSYAQAPTNVGLVVSDNTMFIFLDQLKSLSSNKIVLKRIEQSTLMHEWGHLLGMEHVDKHNCVMSAKVEVFESRRDQEANIPIEYCFETLTQLPHF